MRKVVAKLLQFADGFLNLPARRKGGQLSHVFIAGDDLALVRKLQAIAAAAATGCAGVRSTSSASAFCKRPSEKILLPGVGRAMTLNQFRSSASRSSVTIPNSHIRTGAFCMSAGVMIPPTLPSTVTNKNAVPESAVSTFKSGAVSSRIVDCV